MEVQYNLDNIKKRIANIKTIQRINILAAFEALHNLIAKWGKGIGGDNLLLTQLSAQYKQIKANTGRKPIPNMNYSGQLYGAMSVKKYQDTGAVIYAAGDIQNKKLSGNVEYRNNLLSLSKDTALVARLTKLVSDALKK